MAFFIAIHAIVIIKLARLFTSRDVKIASKFFYIPTFLKNLEKDNVQMKSIENYVTW